MSSTYIRPGLVLLSRRRIVWPDGPLWVRNVVSSPVETGTEGRAGPDGFEADAVVAGTGDRVDG